jgi:dihydroorotate dehydrogenase electron transfer subunit
MKKIQDRAKILFNKKIKGRYFKLVLDSPLIARNALPGQFAMLRVVKPRASEPLLRRPFGIHKVVGSRIEILYEIVGPGTDNLCQRRPGELIDLLAPLGNGFDFRNGQSINRQPVLVAGGMGVAPLVFLAQRLATGKPGSPGTKIQVFIGARTSEGILCEKEFKKLGCDVKISTDDGSAGFSGRVTGLLERALSAMDHQRAVIYACGPRPMLRELVRICRKKLIPAQVSLEAHMACGIGACLGCVVDTIDGYKRVCKEGPVFEAEKLIY